MTQIYKSIISGDVAALAKAIDGMSAQQLDAPVFGKSWSALTMAVRLKKIDCIKLLMSYGASAQEVASPNSDGFLGSIPAIIVAAVDGDEKVLRTLIDMGADVNAKNADDQTALMFCASNYGDSYNEGVVDLLLRNGVNVHDCDKSGNTALHYACKNDCIMLATKLVQEFGADAWVRNSNGATPIELASEAQRQRFADILGSRIANEFSGVQSAAAPSVKSMSPF